MLKTRYAANTPAAEGISHLFDTLKSAPQSEIKAYFVHAAAEEFNDLMTNDLITFSATI
jgi:hypothetical protein